RGVRRAGAAHRRERDAQRRDDPPGRRDPHGAAVVEARSVGAWERTGVDANLQPYALTLPRSHAPRPTGRYDRAARDDLHDGHVQHQVRARGDPRARARPEAAWRSAGHGGDRPEPGAGRAGGGRARQPGRGRARRRALRPVMGIVDPDNTRTLPPMVAACSGLDVLCHAVESLTALPYDRREGADDPALRPAYQGANPISDLWSSQAIRMVAGNIVRASWDPSAEAARGQMLLAAAYAGIGFGNAGVHLPHGMSYPVSGMVREYVPEGYPGKRPLIPHGMSVILNAPAVFRFTAPADPARHLEAARLMG